MTVSEPQIWKKEQVEVNNNSKCSARKNLQVAIPVKRINK